jgi:hypothetical protein
MCLFVFFVEYPRTVGSYRDAAILQLMATKITRIHEEAAVRLKSRGVGRFCVFSCFLWRYLRWAAPCAYVHDAMAGDYCISFEFYCIPSKGLVGGTRQSHPILRQRVDTGFSKRYLRPQSGQTLLESGTTAVCPYLCSEPEIALIFH